MAARTKTTAKPRPAYRCTECGNQLPKWVGRCPECNAWGTVEEYGAVPIRTTAAGPVSSPARPIGQVDGQVATARSTGVPELDRVLGGGLVPGAVVLLAGEPGVGKSTLLLDVGAQAAPPPPPPPDVTGAASAGQVRRRAARVNARSQHRYRAA
ncbi:ATPase domain-containing protein, partial [Kitasatospora sp. NPDC088160]|uniref:ATPase domain-containing protein n=1 Tax=Kitasatospora sp. NPDC088160 TaxID=3364072 RepID=UPI0038302895